MKRFLSIILTAAMLMSATPAVFAENNAVDESVIVAEELNFENQEEITEEVAENVTEDVSEEISGEGEENSEEQISLMSGENDISLMAATIENTVDKTADNAAVKVDGINNDWNDYYFSNLQDAVKAINEHPTNSNTARILITNKAADEISIDKTLSIGSDSVNVSVQIFAQKTCTIKRADDFTGAFFEISEGSSLTFGNKSQSDSYKTLTLDGNKVNVTAKAPLIVSGGELVFNRDIVLQRNLNSYSGGIMGAAIYVGESGSFTMNDGTIANNSTTYLFGDCGGGVYAKGNVTINGGKITGNTQITTYSGYEGETGNSVCIQSAKTLKITGGNLKSNFGDEDQDIILRSYSMSYGDTDTFEYGNCTLELSGSIELSTIGVEIDKRTVNLKDGESNVTLTVKPNIKVTDTLNVSSPITILGGWYFDWTAEPNITYADIPVGTQLVTFADGVSASDYISKFQYKGEEARYFNVDETGGISLSDTAAGHAVAVTDPIYSHASYPGGIDMKIGTIRVSGADNLDSVSEGTELTLAIDINTTYTDAKNHSFVKWVVTTESGSEVSVTDNKFIMPGEAVTVTAEFVPNIKMTFYAGGTYASESNECKNYVWNEDGSITYTMPNDKGTLTISTPNGFKLWKYPSDSETKTPVVTASDVVTVTVNTNDGYIFNGIKSVTDQREKQNGTFNNSGTYTFSVPVGTYEDYRGEQNAYIILDITKQQYNITKNYDSSMGNVQVVLPSTTSMEITKAYRDSNVWIGVEPKENYKIKTVKVADKNNQEVALDTQYAEQYNTWAFTMPASDVTVTVEFELDACGITIDPCEHGSVTTNPSGTAAVGSEVTITATPDTNYELGTLIVTTASGTSVTVADNKFTMPSESVTIKATFVKSKFSVTVEEPENGSVSCDKDGQSVEWGTDIEFTVTPNENYVIDKVTVNGVEIAPKEDGKYKFTTEAKDSIIKATFKKEQFSVTASPTANGKISLHTDSPLDWGENFTINVKADPHYEIDTVIVDGKAVSVNEQGDYTFVMPTHNVTVSATFKKVKYTITGTGDHATFSIPSSDTYNWGDTVEFTVTPDKWYSVKSIYADNETVAITKVDGKENAYSFTMPQGNVIITAVTERPNFTVTFDSKGGSNITPKTVANGDVADKPGVPIWAGRGFAGWYTDEACTQKYDFTAPVTESITLYAHWFLWGDVNNDGVTDSKDALLIRRCKVGLISYDSITNNIAGCVNGISETKSYPDSNDALAIRRFCVGLINRYAVEDSAAGYEFDLENDTYIPKN